MYVRYVCRDNNGYRNRRSFFLTVNNGSNLGLCPKHFSVIVGIFVYLYNYASLFNYVMIFFQQGGEGLIFIFEALII